MDEQVLKRKLAEWAGWKYKADSPYSRETSYGWQAPNDWLWQNSPPDLTNSLDACFKWIVPENCSVCFNHMKGNVVCLLTIPKGTGIYGSYVISSGKVSKGEDALALCLAIEKLIDGESS